MAAPGLPRLRRLQIFDEADQLAVCLLYTSDAADERSSVDLGGRRIIKKKQHAHTGGWGTLKKENATRKERSTTYDEEYRRKGKLIE